jgi:hypothetical protein
MPDQNAYRWQDLCSFFERFHPLVNFYLALLECYSSTKFSRFRNFWLKELNHTSSFSKQNSSRISPMKPKIRLNNINKFISCFTENKLCLHFKDQLSREIIAIHSKNYAMTCRPISRQRPKYTQATIENVLQEVLSMWVTPCPLLGNGFLNTFSRKRTCRQQSDNFRCNATCCK